MQVVLLLRRIQQVYCGSYILSAIFDLFQIHTSARLVIQFAWNVEFLASCL